MSTLKQPAPKASTATDFGQWTGYIHWQDALTVKHSQDGTPYITFKLIVLSLKNEEYGAIIDREYEVWISRKVEDKIKAAFPDGLDDVAKEERRVTVDVADVYAYQVPSKGKWPTVVAVRANDVTVLKRK